MLSRWIHYYCRALTVVMVLCLAAMVIMVFGNVVLRYGFNSGLTLSEELSRWLFVWMTFLGAVVALGERAHLGTDMVVARLPLLGRKICLGIALLLMTGICLWVLQGAWQQTLINWDTTSAVLEASVAWVYGSGVVFAVLALPILLMQLWQLFSGGLSESELVGVRDSEEAA